MARRVPLSLLLLLLAMAPGCDLHQPDPASEPIARLDRAATVCAKGPTQSGIDVARWQGAIDWPSVASSEVSFAFIQVSRSLTDIDPRFDYNWAEARRVGIVRGAYQRMQPAQGGLAQANLFLERMGPLEAGDLPPVLDIEDHNDLSPAAVAAEVRAWMTRVEDALGVKPIIYTGKYFWQDHVRSSEFAAYPLWIAHWGVSCPNLPDQWSDWVFHQTSDKGSVPGITGPVDLNRFNGSMDELRALGARAECGDGLCSGGETTETCPADCPPCQVISAAGDVVDDSSACFRGGGNPQYIRQESAGYGSSLQWTHTTDRAEPANYGLWSLYFEQGGRYQVEAFTPAPFGQSQNAVYQVRHGGSMRAVEIDQSAVDGWSSLGEFDFAAGGGQTIRVDDNTGEPNHTETKLVFDALRFTRVGSGVDGDVDDRNPAGEVTAGCAVGGDRAGPAWLLALLGAAMAAGRRRRRRRAS